MKETIKSFFELYRYNPDSPRTCIEVILISTICLVFLIIVLVMGIRSNKKNRIISSIEQSVSVASHVLAETEENKNSSIEELTKAANDFIATLHREAKESERY